MLKKFLRSRLNFIVYSSVRFARNGRGKPSDPGDLQPLCAGARLRAGAVNTR
jgi:hypothetical protein